jgi:hypothetical protein
MEHVRHAGKQETLTLYFAAELIIIRGTGLQEIGEQLVSGRLSKTTEESNPPLVIERRFYSDRAGS